MWSRISGDFYLITNNLMSVKLLPCHIMSNMWTFSDPNVNSCWKSLDYLTLMFLYVIMCHYYAGKSSFYIFSIISRLCNPPENSSAVPRNNTKNAEYWRHIKESVNPKKYSGKKQNKSTKLQMTILTLFTYLWLVWFKTPA